MTYDELEEYINAYVIAAQARLLIETGDEHNPGSDPIEVITDWSTTQAGDG